MAHAEGPVDMEVEDNQAEEITPRRQTARPKPRTLEMLKKSKKDDEFRLENEEDEDEGSASSSEEFEELQEEIGVLKTPSNAVFKMPTSTSTKKARRTMSASDENMYNTPKYDTRSPSTPTSGPGTVLASEFKVSSRGRHIVPPLQYWRLQTARTDAYGNLVQVTLVRNYAGSDPQSNSHHLRVRPMTPSYLHLLVLIGLALASWRICPNLFKIRSASVLRLNHPILNPHYTRK